MHKELFELPDSLSVIDREEGLRIVMGDESMYRELAELFLEEVAESTSALRSACSESSASTIDRIAHSIKGSAAVVGAARVQAFAAKIEEVAKSGDPQECSAMLPTLELEIERAKGRLQEMFP